jgi:acyl carrier protein
MPMHETGAAKAAIAPRDRSPAHGRSDEERIRAELRRWILAHSKTAPRSTLSDETQLLETGLLSSLDVVELVLFVEELRGGELETDDIEPEAFSSVDAMWHAFFATKE